jgi:hypothetical protein
MKLVKLCQGVLLFGMITSASKEAIKPVIEGAML